MTEKEARDILQRFVEQFYNSSKDDGGNIAGSEHIHVGSRYGGVQRHPLTGETITPDEDVIYFIVYILPKDIGFDSFQMLSEQERGEHGFLWGVTEDGRAFMPEA